MNKRLREKCMAALLLLLPAAAGAQTVDERALLLMRGSDGLSLSRLLIEHKDSLSEGVLAAGNAFVRGCQGDAKQAAKLMRRALKKYSDSFDGPLTAQLTFGVALQQHRCGRDRQAVKTLQRFLQTHDSFAMKTLFQQYERLFGASRAYRQKWKGALDASIPFRLDSVGPPEARSVAVMLRPVVNGQAVDMMLDTGATMHVVSRSVAEQLGLQLTDISIFLDGMGENCGWLAIAKTLRIGNVEARNVPFCVLDDTAIADDLAETAHQKTIIGLPLLQQRGCVQFDFKSQTMHASADETIDERNLSCGFSDNGLLLEVRHHGNRLQLIPDMGATHSAVNARQLTGQQHYLTDYLPHREVEFVGWGGRTAGREYVYPQFDMAVGRTVVTLPQMSVLEGGDYESRLGMDFFSRCERVTIRLTYPAGLSVMPRY